MPGILPEHVTKRFGRFAAGEGAALLDKESGQSVAFGAPEFV